MISVKHLEKCYGDFKAVSDLSFEIEKGKIYGLLGPNGAGKSTTMNMMTGCLSMTSGEITISGHDIFDDAKEAKKLIGYLPEIPPLYLDQTPREYLRFVAKAKGVKKEELNEQIESVISKTGIKEVENRLIKKLSKGYKQRVGIAQAILGNPEVIILDEPTVGLDPAQIIEIRELIKALGKEHTVIISSHILSEIQEMCDEVIIISHGKLVLFDKISNLDNVFKISQGFEIKAYSTVENLKDILSKLSEVKDFEVTTVDSEISKATIHVETDDMDKMGKDLFIKFSELKLPVIQINPIKTSLEDIFIELTGQSEEEQVDKEVEHISLFKRMFSKRKEELNEDDLREGNE